MMRDWENTSFIVLKNYLNFIELYNSLGGPWKAIYSKLPAKGRDIFE